MNRQRPNYYYYYYYYYYHRQSIAAEWSSLLFALIVVCAVDCSKCNFTHGQIWQPDFQNCHMFYVCEPFFDSYNIHHMTCGELYWSQESTTCVREPTPGILCGDVVDYIEPNKTQGMHHSRLLFANNNYRSFQ